MINKIMLWTSTDTYVMWNVSEVHDGKPGKAPQHLFYFIFVMGITASKEDRYNMVKYEYIKMSYLFNLQMVQ